MQNSKIIVSLAIFLLCSSVFCSGNFDLPKQQQKKNKPAYTLTLKWPYAKDYQGTKYSREEFPTFDGDNFAIEKFHPNAANSNGCFARQCPNKPFSFDKVSDCDAKYLSKYIENFDKNNYENLKNLWEVDGSCTKSTETQYFSDLVKVHQKFNLIKAMKASGIVPSKTTVYSSEQIGKALSGLLGGKKPTFYCSSPIEMDANGDIKPPILRYLHLQLDENLNAADEQYTLCTYEYCGRFVIPPIDY